MKIKNEIVKKAQRKVLENLLQLYLHDISLYFPMDFDSNNGIYAYDDIDNYFDNNSCYPYFIKDDMNIVGFMLIKRNNDNIIMQEMFVLNNYKGKGIGKEAVIQIFNRLKGNWIIKSLPCSPKAENFWIKTVNDYTNNKCVIEHVGKFNRAVLTFNNLIN